MGVFIPSGELAHKRSREGSRESSPACQTIVQAYFGSLEFLGAARVSSSTLTDLVVGTTCVDLNLSLNTHDQPADDNQLQPRDRRYGMTHRCISGGACFWRVGLLDRFNACLRRGDVVIQIRECLVG